MAEWGASLFAEPGGDYTLVDDKVAELRARTDSGPERVLEALEFVQKEIRYFGTEKGPFTHTPAPPPTVIRQRFGDCKDKVQLLRSLLSRLDVPSSPVFVSTMYGDAVETMLPSPLAFDHAITKVEIADQTYWLDGTKNHQQGGLADRQALGLEKGLIVASGVTRLASLPDASAYERVSVEESFVIHDFGEPVSLTSEITYHNDFAEAFRQVLATGDVANLESVLREPYVQHYPAIHSVGRMRVEDSETSNAITFVQHFAIPDFWSLSEYQLHAQVAIWQAVETLRVPNQLTRQHPYALVPGVYTHAIRMEFPESVYEEPVVNRFHDRSRHFSFRTTANGHSGKVLEYEATVHILDDTVTPKEWPAHRDKVLSVAAQLGLNTSIPAIPEGQRRQVAKELEDLNARIDAGKVNAATEHQERQLIESLLHTALLEGGRLSQAQRADTHYDRGVAYDKLGKYEEARDDFDAALAIAGNDAGYLLGAAENALMLGDFDRALSLTDELLTQDPEDSETHYVRARTFLLAGEYSDARRELETVLEDPDQVRRGFPLLHLDIAARHMGDESGQVIQDYVPELPDGWPRPLLDLVRGEVAETDVLQSVQSGDKMQHKLCEAYYYIGARHLAEGNHDEAKQYFRKSVSQGVTEYIEHTAASLELQRLD